MRFIDHPDQDLDPRAFAGDGRVYGKSSPPPPPDYRAAAQETAAGNLEAARAATRANRVDQITPWGSLTWSQTQQPTIDWDAYNAAQQSWQQRQFLPGSSSSRQFVTDPRDRNGSFFRRTTIPGNTSNIPAPRPEDFMRVSDPDGGWRQTVSLAPEAQAALDSQMRMSQRFGNLAEQGLRNAESVFANPRFDTSGMPDLRLINEADFPTVRALNSDGLTDLRGLDLNTLPQAAISPGMTAQEALLSRINPTLSREEEQLRTRLANQGITLGSQAYNREMELAAQRANDLRLQAAAQGISLDQAARQQALGEQQALLQSDLSRRGTLFGERRALSDFDLRNRSNELGVQQGLSANAADVRARMMQEQAMQQDRPLNLINALRSGAQVQNPTFQSFAQQATTAGPNMLGAAQANYGAQMDAFNAQQAQQGGLMSGLFGVGMGIAGLPMAGGGSLGGLFGSQLMRGGF